MVSFHWPARPVLRRQAGCNVVVASSMLVLYNNYIYIIFFIIYVK